MVRKQMRSLIAKVPPNIISWSLIALALCVIASTNPTFSLLALICLILLLVAGRTHYTEWSRRIRNGELEGGKVLYIDRPSPSLFTLTWEGGWYVILVTTIAVALGQANYRNLSTVQWIPILVGLSIWMPGWRVYLPLMYVVTDQGIWIQEGLSRAFLPFSDLSGVMHYPGRKSSTKGAIAYISRMSNFVMLFLKDLVALHTRKGPIWTRIVLLTPTHCQKFMQHLPNELIE